MSSQKKPDSQEISSPLDAALASVQHADIAVAGPVSSSMASWLAENFNKNFDEYDRAIDAVYNATGIGGSRYHHLLDGQHTLWGALQAVKDVRPDDSFATELYQAVEHLLRDAMSVSGINPFLSPEGFEHICVIGEPIGLSRPYLADALTFNGPEMLGGGIALAASVLVGRKYSPDHLSTLSGAYVASALASGNPLLMPIAAGGLAYALAKSDNPKETLIQGGKGALVSGSALLMSSLVGGPMWLGCLTAVLTGVAVKYSLDNPEQALSRTKKLADDASQIFRKASRIIREDG